MTKVLALLHTFGLFLPKHTIRYIPAQNRSRNWQGVSVVLVVASVLLAGSYLFGANSYAAAGYEIGQLQKSINQLTQENKKLTLKVSEQSSIAAVQAEVEYSNFVPVEQAKFLEVRYYTQK